MTPNAEQLRAIYGRKGKKLPALRVVIAGPGSGKTFTLAEAVKAVAQMNIITVMTFTNGAANVLQKRIGDIRLAYIGTTHGYCYKLIQRFGELIGYRSGEVVLLPDAERIPRLLAVRDRLGIKISQEKLLRPDIPMDMERDGVTEKRMLISKEYQFLLKRSNLVDFDSILSEAVVLLSKDEVRAAMKLDFLFVDERQDSNGQEHFIYNLIPAAHKFFVGDPDQSLYEFRGADPQGFVEMANLPQADVITLEKNYRSDRAICDTANKLIGHNQMRVPKLIKPVSKERGAVAVRRFDDTWQELEFIGREIRKIFEADDETSIAVLCRTNYEVKRVHTYLLTASLPVATPVLGELRPPDWERATLLLSLAVAPDNEILAERYLKLDHDTKQVDRWILEGRATGNGISARIRSVLAPSLHKAPRFLAENGVSESTIGLIKQRVSLLPADANMADLVRDLYTHEDLRMPTAEKGIQVLTGHSAKGLEFDVVFMPAFEQGIIPSLQSMKEPQALEGERRLAFVMLTRARHIVYITYVVVRQSQWGAPADMQPSQFIAEAGL